MTKQNKLRRYQRKDYSQVVDFPVEIVGRDGVVRAYSFEESVRLYQRRIASAALRYDDKDVIDAEVSHCQRRIKQLRLSYLEHHGWDEIRTMAGLMGIDPDLMGEVAAFLRRHNMCVLGSPDQLNMEALEKTSSHRLFHLSCPGNPPEARLLYLFQFESHESCQGRESFSRIMEILKLCVGDDCTEQLLAFHQQGDCGIILTGRSPTREGMFTQDMPELAVARQISSRKPGPFGDAIASIRRGELQRALVLLDSILHSQPDHRNAVLAASMAAEMLGRWEQAEMYARFGCHQHPEDQLLWLNLGLALLHQDKLEQARSVLSTAIRKGTSNSTIRFLLSIVELRTGHPLAALGLLRNAGRQCGWKEQEMAGAVRRLRRRISVHVGMVLLGILIMIAGVSAMLAGHWPGLLALPAAAFTWLICRRSTWNRTIPARMWLGDKVVDFNLKALTPGRHRIAPH